MKVYVYPHGLEIQKHYEELRAQGVEAAGASAASLTVEIDWPAWMRLPVVGDSITYGWFSGKVASVAFLFDDEYGFEIRIHLS